MDQRPIVIRENSSVTVFLTVVVIAAIVAVGLFFWQPWNATASGGTHTTIINQAAPAAAQAPAAAAPAAGAANAGTTSNSGSGSAPSH